VSERSVATNQQPIKSERAKKSAQTLAMYFNDLYRLAFEHPEICEDLAFI